MKVKLTLKQLGKLIKEAREPFGDFDYPEWMDDVEFHKGKDPDIEKAFADAGWGVQLDQDDCIMFKSPSEKTYVTFYEGDKIMQVACDLLSHAKKDKQDLKDIEAAFESIKGTVEMVMTSPLTEAEDGEKKLKVKITDVDWDVEEQDIADTMKGDPNDPKQVQAEIDRVKKGLNKQLQEDPYLEVDYAEGQDLNDIVGNAVSEKFGWLVNGFNFEPVEDTISVTEDFDTEDGWDCDEIRDSGLMDTLRKCANLHYTLDKCTRASANFGETLGDLKAYVNELGEEMMNEVAGFPEGDEEVMERKGDVVSDDDVRELVLYITNDSDLYHRWVEPIIANLRKKVKRGVYNPELAVKLWKRLADEGAKKYDKELNDGPGRVDWLNVPTRVAIAKELCDHYQEQVNAVEDEVTIDEAIPRTLKEIDAAKARKIIAKALRAGTGEWEGQPELSDFVYQTPSGKYMLLRKSWGDHWETGRVSL